MPTDATDDRALIAAIFAGGAGRRFGGGKAASCGPFVADILERAGLRVFTVGGAIGDARCADDWPIAGLGPLGALCGAMRHAAACGFARVLTVPCDALPLPVDLVAQLGTEVPAVADGNHLIGLWPTAASDALEAHLASSSDRSMARWCAVAGARRVDVTGIGNINTRDDFGRYRASLESARNQVRGGVAMAAATKGAGRAGSR